MGQDIRPVSFAAEEDFMSELTEKNKAIVLWME